jgi:hypothetical protein
MTAEPLRELLAKMNGAKVYGGCDECDAYQTMEADPDLPHVFHLRIHHDDWCPFLARIGKN